MYFLLFMLTLPAMNDAIMRTNEIIGHFKVQDGKRRERKKKKAGGRKPKLDFPRLEVIWLWGSRDIRDMLETPGWRRISVLLFTCL